MAWALAAALTPANPRLAPTKPTMTLCSKRILLPTLEVVVLACITQAGCFGLMTAQAWYHGGNSSSQQARCCACYAPAVSHCCICLCHHSLCVALRALSSMIEFNHFSSGRLFLANVYVPTGACNCTCMQSHPKSVIASAGRAMCGSHFAPTTL